MKKERKSPTKKAELDKLAEQLKVVGKEYREIADAEEKERTDTLKKIQDMADDGGFFCGAVLGAEELATAVKIAVVQGQVKIPAQLYYNEETVKQLTKKSDGTE